MSRTRTDLDRSLVHGIAWTSAVTWFSQLLTWGATLYVINKLLPEDYGLVGAALLFLGIVQMFSEFGVGSAVVRFQALTRDQIAQFNALALMLGIGGAAVTVALAKPVAWFLEDPDRLPPLMMVMSIGFILTGLRVVPQALMQRDLQFRKLAVMEGIMSISMAASNITMASRGFGKWTLVFGPLVGSALMMLMVVVNNPVPFRRPNFKEIGKPFEFSRQIILTRFAWWGYSNADYLIITKTIGKAAFGIYQIGWTFSGIAVEKITSLVGRVTPAIFSAVQDNLADIRRYLLLLTEGLALLTFPVCIGLSLVTNDVVSLLKPHWQMAAFPLQMLSILACVRSIDPLLQQALTAIGEARMNLNNTLLTVCVLPFGLYGGLLLGESLTGMPRGTDAALGGAINGVAVAWLILGPLLFSRLLFKGLARIELPVRQYAAALWPAVSGSLLMAAVVMVISVIQPSRTIVWFVIKVVAGAVTYVLTLLLMHRERVMVARELIAMLRSKTPIVAPPAQPAGEGAAQS